VAGSAALASDIVIGINPGINIGISNIPVSIWNSVNVCTINDRSDLTGTEEEEEDFLFYRVGLPFTAPRAAIAKLWV
jgi:hypothetical protein